MQQARIEGGHYDGRDGYRDMGYVVIGNAPEEGNAHAALVEALEAFVSEDPYCSVLPESLAIALDEAGAL
jgi:hypothetical protein